MNRCSCFIWTALLGSLVACSSWHSPFRSALPEGNLRVQRLSSRELGQGVFRLAGPPQSLVSPIFLEDNRVLLATMGGVLEVKDMKTLASIWRHQIAPGIQARPFVAGSFVWVAGMDAKIRKVRLQNGNVEWEAPLPAESLGGISASQGLLFVTAADDSLSALDERTGKALWNYKRPARSGHVLWSLEGEATPQLSPDGQVVYCGFSDGTFVALESASGKTLWERNFERIARFQDADTTPMLSADGSLIFLSLVDSDLVILRARDGSTLNSFPGAAATAPFVDFEEKALYLSTREGKLTKYSLEDQRTLWSVSLGKRGMGSRPVPLWKDYLALTTTRSGLILVDRKNGKILWEDSYATGSLGAPTFDGRRLAVISARNWLHIYSLERRL